MKYGIAGAATYNAHLSERLCCISCRPYRPRSPCSVAFGSTSCLVGRWLINELRPIRIMLGYRCSRLAWMLVQRFNCWWCVSTIRAGGILVAVTATISQTVITFSDLLSTVVTGALW